jgi:hypothetical protein
MTDPRNSEAPRPRIKNDPATYRTRASLASAPPRDGRESPKSRDINRAFLTAPIDAAGYIDLRAARRQPGVE